MDQERFDTFTRTLASGISRRGVLRRLGTVVAGGALVAAGGGSAVAKGACKAPNHRCGKGKNAQCCTSGEICREGACVVETRTISLVWNPWVNQTAPTDHGFCYPSVSVTGFAPGTYTAYAYTTPVTIEVGVDGTASGSNQGHITGASNDFTTATLDGVTSAPASMDCWNEL